MREKIIFAILILLLGLSFLFIPKKDTAKADKEVYAEVVDIVSPLNTPDILVSLSTPSPTPTVTPKPTKKPKPTKTPKPTKKPKKKKAKKKKKDIRTFKVTAYCPCSRCSGGYGAKTSTGKTPKEGRTIAVDPKVIPYGTKIKFNGNIYVAEDCGGAIKGNRIDIFMKSHSACLKWGVRTVKAEVLKKKKSKKRRK